jgi:hypothetical protein
MSLIVVASSRLGEAEAEAEVEVDGRKCLPKFNTNSTQTQSSLKYRVC